MERVRLSEVIKIMESGGRPKGGASNISTGVPSIGGEHIERDGTINFQNKRYIPNDYFEKMKRGHISHNDILIVKDGATTGKVAYVDAAFPQPAAVNEHVFRLTVNSDKVLPRYVFYHLLSSLGNRQILKDFRGSTIGGISQDFPEKIEFCLPEMSKQKIVVKALDRAKQLFRTRCLALDICDSMPQSFFFHMFGDPKRNTHDWGQKILGDELDCIESGSSPVCEGQRLNSNEWAVLSLGAVTYGIFDPEQNKRLPENIRPDESLEVKKGDVLISRKNTVELVATSVYVHESPPRLLLPDTIFRFKLKRNSALNSEYLWGLFSFPSFKKYIQGFATGTAGSMPNISKEKLLSVTIPVPPIAMQQQFSKAIFKHYRLRKHWLESLRQSDHLFQSLLHQAFSYQ